MGPKGKGVNTKVAAANEKKAAVQGRRDAQKAQEEERKTEQEWNQGANTRGAARGAQAEERAAEQKRKAAEKAALLAQEEAELARIKPKSKAAKAAPAKPWEAALGETKKVTKFEREQEAERRAKMEQEMKAKASANDVVVDESELAENLNRQAENQWASGLDSALQELNVRSTDAGADRFPEKRMKAAYRAFEESQLPLMRESKPGLKLSQYKQLIFTAWQRSPENPLNQVQSTAAAAGGGVER